MRVSPTARWRFYYEDYTPQLADTFHVRMRKNENEKKHRFALNAIPLHVLWCVCEQKSKISSSTAFPEQQRGKLRPTAFPCTATTFPLSFVDLFTAFS